MERERGREEAPKHSLLSAAHSLNPARPVFHAANERMAFPGSRSRISGVFSLSLFGHARLPRVRIRDPDHSMPISCMLAVCQSLLHAGSTLMASRRK